jgi:type I restriction enzyme S subunit
VTARTVSLGDVAEFVNGAAFSEADWSETGMKIIRIQNLTDSRKPFNRTERKIKDSVRVRPGDLLVSWSATLGVFEWLDSEDALLNQHIFRVVPDPTQVAKPYLRHVLQIAVADMERHVHGATMKHINRGEFLGMQIPLPPLEEQRRIASILDAADALRTKRRQALAKLDTLTQAIFIDMFGDPLSNTNGYPTVNLEEVASQVTDGEHATPPRTDEGVRLLSARNVRDGHLDLTNVDHVSQETYEKLRKRCDPQAGDLLISCSGSIGRVAQVDGSAALALVRSVALVRPKGESIESSFLEAYLQTPAMRRLMVKRANASSQANLFQNQIRRLPVLLPPIDEQMLLVKRLKATKATARKNTKSSAYIDELFASLQHRAFRGEL